MELDLKRLQQVLAVVRTGTISKAAEELHMTQPALSRSIAALEERYGFRIFERGRGGAALTPVGRAVVQEAEALLQHALATDHNFKLYQSGEAGQIAFGMGPLIASLLLPGLSVHFLQERPQLDLHAVVRSAAVLYEELMADHIEILFCSANQLAGKAGVSGRVVGDVAIANIVRAGHPLANHAELYLRDLAGFPTLIGAEPNRGRPQGQRATFVCDNYHILRDTTLNTDGVWVSSPALVREDIEAGRLQVLAVVDDPLQTTVEVFMVTREGSHLSPAAQAVFDYARDFLTKA
ncbi:LysR family transcriptional regulator [Halioxenophilus sp. WMMB6]|uniref:LysR family transcriptional regulator n=1 Tax=Halioxenophilus sp. WMMB6 TaxID=3073815 RepID=UPI00295E65B3|nr:LysR family transcriptional regulator [Halioxenophilus sp. WMMB6]